MAVFSFLSPDSKFMTVISRFADLVFLNLLFVVTCLPVFTVGAAGTAMYSVLFRMIRQREGSIVKAYFRAFGENFRQGTALWLLYLFITVPGAVYLDILYHREGPVRYLFALFLLILILAVFVIGYALPWISQFRNRIGDVLRNSLILSLSHIPQTLCLCGLNLLPWVLLAVKPDLLLDLSFLFVALYFSAAAYMNAALLWKVFKPYFPEDA